MSQSDRKRLKRIRDAVIQRDGLICCYCEKTLLLEEVTMEHIIPSSQKGTFNSTNLTVSCAPCNNGRSDYPFFDFIERYKFSEKKLSKYKTLYFNNIRIKVLNVAKEQCIHNYYEVPQDLIDKSCSILKIKSISYTDLLDRIDISFDSFHKRNEIVSAFERLIRLIEEKS